MKAITPAIIITAAVASTSTAAQAQTKLCLSVAFDIQTTVGASLIHQGNNTIRLSHPAVREIQVTCSGGLTTTIDHIWTSAYGTAPDIQFNDMVDTLWRLAGGAPRAGVRNEIKECLRRAVEGFGPPDYFVSVKTTIGHIDCSYGTIIDGKNNNKIAYAVTLKIKPAVSR